MFDLFDDFFDTALNREATREIFPPKNVYVTENGDFVMELALAGYKKEDLDVSVDNGSIIVSANPTVTSEDNARYIQHRVRKESFKRCYTSPLFSDENLPNLQASFTDGILKIVIPPVKQVEVKKSILIE